MSIILILVIIVLLIVGWIVTAYNRLVSLKNRANEAFADIDVQLKRRYDLIPNLVETVKGYAAHERELFEKVTEARAKAMGAREGGDVKKLAEAENYLTQTLKHSFCGS
jgi:LemA protein